jgi:saccharopine dehydrogenase-like NADP-dependent oxidoreductase
MEKRSAIYVSSLLWIIHELCAQETLTSTLELYGSPSGHSAMAFTVGLPCGIATQLVLDGVLKTPGVHAPYTKEICDPIRERLEKHIGMVERVL